MILTVKPVPLPPVVATFDAAVYPEPPVEREIVAGTFCLTVDPTATTAPVLLRTSTLLLVLIFVLTSKSTP